MHIIVSHTFFLSSFIYKKRILPIAAYQIRVFVTVNMCPGVYRVSKSPVTFFIFDHFCLLQILLYFQKVTLTSSIA